MKPATLNAILAARHNGTALAIITRLSDGAQSRFEGGQAEGPVPLSDAVLAEVSACLASDRSRLIEDGSLFVHVHNPPARLIIVGAVHIAQALAPMAALAGYDVTVIDPRGAFATLDRFPDTQLLDDWPDEALENLRPDTRTAVVTLTHDPKLDDPALAAALRSPAFYIAALGGMRTHGRRLERLRAEGFDEASLTRINGPAGLPIAAVSPAEIAVSVIAQMTAVKHGRPPGLGLDTPQSHIRRE